MARDWQAARANKDAYWKERIARLGSSEAFRIADELRRQMQMIDPAWPDQAARDDDLASHVRLADCFRRADAARGR
jgi:hypothetical protein